MRVIDSHTGGAATRVVVEGGPDVGDGPMCARVRRFEREADGVRRLLVREPRGHEAMVGALLCEPSDTSCAAGVIFFNNRGYLGMCGHGGIGVAVRLARLGRIGPGLHKLETPVGTVTVDLLDHHRAAIENVPSFRHQAGVRLDVDGVGTVTGDVAWGGNWFFLAHTTPCRLVAENIARLSRRLGCSIPVEPGKEYSVTMGQPDPCPTYPMLFPEHRVGVTPFDNRFRLGSMMELSGYDSTVPRQRIAQLRESAIPYLVTPFTQGAEETWYGWRPRTWDSLPIIGSVPNLSNAYLATGHNMLGLSLATATARLIAEMICGAPTHIDAAAFSPQRFN
jgi:hypothetical protein